MTGTLSADRRRAMLRTAMGPEIAAALADPLTQEIMVNPDGALRLDRLGEGRTDTEIRMDPAQVERIVRSGLTLGHAGKTMVVLNSAHVRERQCSTLMHELAHIRLGHVPASVRISETGMLLLSDYSDEQEDEADWLMGALLLPRAALLQYRSRGQTLEQIAAAYNVSDDLCRWRLRMTGVDTQLRLRN